MDGEANQLSIGTVESYGPQVTLGIASGAASPTISVSGSNFAGNAAVSIAVDGVNHPGYPGGSIA